MKKLTALLAALILCLTMAACSKTPEAAAEPAQQPDASTVEAPAETAEAQPEEQPAEAQPEEQPEAQPETMPEVELVGPWHLDGEANDEAVLAERFAGYAEWGASMEIRSSGEISWYIGAEAWHGTYEADGAVLHAEMESDLEEAAAAWDLRVRAEDGNAALEMDCDGLTLRWVYGDQPDAPAGE